VDGTVSALIYWITHSFNWTSLLLVLTIAVLLVWIYRTPHFYQERTHDQRLSESAQRLQIDQYYRESNGSEIKDNLAWWTEFLADPTKKAEELGGNESGEMDQEHIDLLNDRMKFIMQFGSARTVKLLALYMEKTYTKSLDNDGVLICLAYIVASLKSDYTGQNALPLDLLRIKFNDFEANERKYRRICRKIKRVTGIDQRLTYHQLK
jgi:hypothetical protein